MPFGPFGLVPRLRLVGLRCWAGLPVLLPAEVHSVEGFNNLPLLLGSSQFFGSGVPKGGRQQPQEAGNSLAAARESEPGWGGCSTWRFGGQVVEELRATFRSLGPGQTASSLFSARTWAPERPPLPGGTPSKPLCQARIHSAFCGKIACKSGIPYFGALLSS